MGSGMTNCTYIKSDFLELIYPVGSIYISLSDTSPEVFIGGNWIRISGRFLLGCGTHYMAQQTGGSDNTPLSLSEMPKHRHSIRQLIRLWECSYGLGAKCNYRDGETSLAGGTNNMMEGQSFPHSNMPPYLVVNIWERTA